MANHDFYGPHFLIKCVSCLVSRDLFCEGKHFRGWSHLQSSGSEGEVPCLLCDAKFTVGRHIHFLSVCLATVFLLSMTNYIFSSSWTERPWHCLGRMTWQTASRLWTLKGYISTCVRVAASRLGLNVCVFICKIAKEISELFAFWSHSESVSKQNCVT